MRWITLILIALTLIGCSEKGNNMATIGYNLEHNTTFIDKNGFNDNTPNYDINQDYNVGDIVKIGDSIYEMLPNGELPAGYMEKLSADDAWMMTYGFKTHDNNKVYEIDGKIYKFKQSFDFYQLPNFYKGSRECAADTWDGLINRDYYPIVNVGEYDIRYISEYNSFIVDSCIYPPDHDNDTRKGITLNAHNEQTSEYEAYRTEFLDNNTVGMSFYTFKFYSNAVVEIGKESIMRLSNNKLLLFNKTINVMALGAFEEVELLYPKFIYKVNHLKAFDDKNLTKAIFNANDSITFSANYDWNGLSLSGVRYVGDIKIEVLDNNNTIIETIIKNVDYTDYLKYDKTLLILLTKHNLNYKVKATFLSNSGEIGTIELVKTAYIGLTDLNVTHNIKDYNSYEPNLFGYIEENKKPIYDLISLKLYKLYDEFDNTVEQIKALKGKFITIDTTDYCLNGEFKALKSLVSRGVFLSPTIRTIKAKNIDNVLADHIEITTQFQEVV